MTKNRVTETVETIETTLGELIETITQLALEAGKSEKESYAMAAVAVESILRRSRRPEQVLN